MRVADPEDARAGPAPALHDRADKEAPLDDDGGDGSGRRAERQQCAERVAGRRDGGGRAERADPATDGRLRHRHAEDAGQFEGNSPGRRLGSRKLNSLSAVSVEQLRPPRGDLPAAAGAAADAVGVAGEQRVPGEQPAGRQRVAGVLERQAPVGAAAPPAVDDRRTGDAEARHQQQLRPDRVAAGAPALAAVGLRAADGADPVDGDAARHEHPGAGADARLAAAARPRQRHLLPRLGRVRGRAAGVRLAVPPGEQLPAVAGQLRAARRRVPHPVEPAAVVRHRPAHPQAEHRGLPAAAAAGDRRRRPEQGDRHADGAQLDAARAAAHAAARGALVPRAHHVEQLRLQVERAQPARTLLHVRRGDEAVQHAATEPTAHQHRGEYGPKRHPSALY